MTGARASKGLLVLVLIILPWSVVPATAMDATFVDAHAVCVSRPTGNDDITQEARDDVPADVPLAQDNKLLLGVSSTGIGSTAPFTGVAFDLATPDLGAKTGPAGRLNWMWFDGEGYRPLDVDDGTNSFSQSGVVRFEAPVQWKPHPAPYNDTCEEGLYYLKITTEQAFTISPRATRLWIEH